VVDDPVEGIFRTFVAAGNSQKKGKRFATIFPLGKDVSLNILEFHHRNHKGH